MKHISHSAIIHLHSEPDAVFPLFTPLGEYHWVEHWRPAFVYPETGQAGVGTIFKTQQTSNALKASENPPDSIWVTVKYDPINHIAAYISVTPDVAVVRVDIRCRATDDHRTAADIRYDVTALSEHGQQSVESMTEIQYQARMEEWERAINYYLEHGKPIFEESPA